MVASLILILFDKYAGAGFIQSNWRSSSKKLKALDLEGEDETTLLEIPQFTERVFIHAVRKARVASTVLMSVTTRIYMVGMDLFKENFKGLNIICSIVVIVWASG